MNDNGIPFKSLIDKIGADTADIADAVKSLPILQDTHLTAHITFFHDLIEDIHAVQAILGLSLFVDRIHDGQRTLLEELLIHHFTGHRAAGQLRLGFGFRYGFRFRLRLRFRC